MGRHKNSTRIARTKMIVSGHPGGIFDLNNKFFRL
jgi:hypothetical protein